MTGLKGYMVSYRDKFRLLKGKKLNEEEFVLRDYCIHAAVWDEDHKETFGTFENTNEEIAQDLGWSESKVSRWRGSLAKKGEIIERPNRRIEVPEYWRYLQRNACKLTKENANLQNPHSGMQEGFAKMQDSGDDLFLGSRYKTRTNTDKDKGVVAKMQDPLSPKLDISSFKGSFNTSSPEEDFDTFSKRAVAELKENDPLRAGGYALLPEEMVAAGFAPDTLHEPCPICKSGVEFINCCGPAMYESLKGVRG